MNENEMFKSNDNPNDKGCFGLYMLGSSVLYTYFGRSKRKQSERTEEENRLFEERMIKAKEKFSEQLEDRKVRDMRAKMIVARKYRAEENFEKHKYIEKEMEIDAFFSSYLPIKDESIRTAIDESQKYYQNGYDSSCPLNVVLLHHGPVDIDYDDSINESLEKIQNSIGNIVFREWCDRYSKGNGTILNLHALMANIPTLVVAPYYSTNDKLYFTISMWEAQSDKSLLIKPAFSINCNRLPSPEKEDYKSKVLELQKQILYSTILLSGCARDTYMLFSQGIEASFPHYIEEHEDFKQWLLSPKNEEIRRFVLKEYASNCNLLPETCPSGALSKDEMGILKDMVEETNNKIKSLLN